MSDSATPWTTARQTSLSFTISWSLLRLVSIETVMPSNHLIFCPPTSLLALNLSQHQGLFQWVGCLHYVAKVLELQLQHQPFQYSGLISFGLTGWISQLSKGLSWVFPAPQFKSISSSVLSLLYGPVFTSIHDCCKKAIALAIQTFVGNMMSLLFNTLSRFVITFRQWIWAHLPTAVDIWRWVPATLFGTGLCLPALSSLLSVYQTSSHKCSSWLPLLQTKESRSSRGRRKVKKFFKSCHIRSTFKYLRY